MVVWMPSPPNVRFLRALQSVYTIPFDNVEGALSMSREDNMQPTCGMLLVHESKRIRCDWQ